MLIQRQCVASNQSVPDTFIYQQKGRFIRKISLNKVYIGVYIVFIFEWSRNFEFRKRFRYPRLL